MDISSKIEGKYHHFIRNKESKDLLIIFSHLGRKPPKFAWFKTFQKIQVNLLFVNCDGLEWYRAGVRSLADGGIMQTLEIFSEIAKRIHPKCNVFMAGGSMGGYGALLYGSLFGAKAIFSSAAEMVLGLPGGRSSVLERDQWSHIYPDLRVVAGKPIKRHIVYGAMHLLDTLSSSLYRESPQTTLYSVDSGDHAVSDVLAKDGILVDCIERMLNGENSILDRSVYPGGLAQDGITEDVWHLNALLEKREYETALPLVKEFAFKFSDHPLPAFLLGNLLLKLKDYLGAQEFMERAETLCGTYPPIFLSLGVIAARRKQYGLSLQYLNKSLELDSSPSITHFQIGEVMRASGDSFGAIPYYQTAIKINPKHAGYQECLNIVLAAKPN